MKPKQIMAALLVWMVLPSGSGWAQAADVERASGVRAFEDFELILERNIFDPERRAPQEERAAPPPRPPEPEFFSLRGTLLHGEQAFAFFDGSRDDYQTALQVNGVIADYRVLAIGVNDIQLQATQGEEKLKLVMGGELRRIGDGPWRLEQTVSPRPGDFRSSVNTSGGDNEDSGGSEPLSGSAAEILKKMMERRRQELQ